VPNFAIIVTLETGLCQELTGRILHLLIFKGMLYNQRGGLGEVKNFSWACNEKGQDFRLMQSNPKLLTIFVTLKA